MSLMEIAIEIGTTNTSIFVSGNGVVLREPTTIAFIGDAKQKKIRAVGREAFEMQGKTPERTHIVCPVNDGIITNPEAMQILLREFLRKIIPDTYFLPKIKVILGIPTGLSLEERRMYESVVYTSNKRIKEVILIENILLAGIGIDLPIATSTGGLVVNIGGGTTEIAAMSLGGVISGCGINIGGDMMDRAIKDSIAGIYDLKLGMASVRKLKNSIGTLYENDLGKMVLSGTDIRTKNVASCLIDSSVLREALQPYYLRVGDATESIINMCPPEINSDFQRTGIYVVGGASQVSGLDVLLSNRLGLDVFIPQDPEYAVIVGAGKLLSDSGLLKELLSQNS